MRWRTASAGLPSCPGHARDAGDDLINAHPGGVHDRGPVGDDQRTRGARGVGKIAALHVVAYGPEIHVLTAGDQLGVAPPGALIHGCREEHLHLGTREHHAADVPSVAHPVALVHDLALAADHLVAHIRVGGHL